MAGRMGWALLLTVATCALLSCSSDWDSLDPRLGGTSSGEAGAGATAGGGGAGAAGGGGLVGGGGGGDGGAGGGVIGPGPTTARFRSVGPGNTQALATGAANPLTISGVTASFARPLPDIIGVGDVVQYDADADGDIDGDDAVAFVHARVSSTEYEVRDAHGEVPRPVSGEASWTIYRAYTSLADAVVGSENPAIVEPLRDFDAWVGGRDLLAENEVWNIACYADAVDDEPVVIEGWATSASNPLRIFTPVGPELVGESQRHDGTAGTGYVMNTSTAPPPLAHVIDLRSHHVQLEGLEITGWLNEPTDNSWEGVHVAANGAVLSALIIHGDQHPNTNNPNGDAINLEDMLGGWTFTVRNTVIYDISRGAINAQGDGAIVAHIENCTVFNTATTGAAADDQGGIAFGGGALVTVTNTISVGNGGLSPDFNKVDNVWGTSSNNISTDASAPGPNSLTGVAGNELFVSPTNLHLHGGAVAIDAAVDLPGFSVDIDGDDRPPGAWDIGADEHR